MAELAKPITFLAAALVTDELKATVLYSPLSLLLSFLPANTNLLVEASFKSTAERLLIPTPTA